TGDTDVRMARIDGHAWLVLRAPAGAARAHRCVRLAVVAQVAAAGIIPRHLRVRSLTRYDGNGAEQGGCESNSEHQHAQSDAHGVLLSRGGRSSRPSRIFSTFSPASSQVLKRSAVSILEEDGRGSCALPS